MWNIDLEHEVADGEGRVALWSTDVERELVMEVSARLRHG